MPANLTAIIRAFVDDAVAVGHIVLGKRQVALQVHTDRQHGAAADLGPTRGAD